MDNQQRSPELEALARENGWDFWLTAEISAIPVLQKFEFHTGEKRKIKKVENLIKTENLTIFDVFFKSGFEPLDAAAMTHQDSSARNIRQQTMFCLESKDLHLPGFHIYPSDALSLIDRWLDRTFRRISFAGNDEFEKRWSVRSDNKQVRNYFSREVIEFYNQSQDLWTFGNGNNLFIYEPNTLILPLQVKDWIKKIVSLSALFKAN